MTIKEVQNIIKEHDMIPYYNIYSQEEEGYWANIPQMILNKQNVTNILDIGGAYGCLALFSKINKNANLYALDLFQYMPDKLIKKYNIKYKELNIELQDSPWEELKFDIIILTEILEHFNFNPVPTMIKIKELLSEDGIIMLSTPDASSWGTCGIYKSWEEMPEPNKDTIIQDCHIHQFNESELIEVIKKSGLKIDIWGKSTNKYGLKHFNIQLSRV